MNKRFIRGCLLLGCVLGLYGQDSLLQRHREWLDLVDPIITETERGVFRKLNSARERDSFIQVFWKRRDPLPDTGENEFYREYMERVRFADTNFGHDSPRKGSRTERGRFYLILGPPLERQIFATQSNLQPLELWHYRGEQKYGLPPFFYLIFFQERGLGEYRLYSPSVDGPAKLLSLAAAGRGIDRSAAYRLIKNISGELAGASLSYLPGDASPGLTSLSSVGVVADILALAEKRFSDDYARQFLNYKDFVETEYSHNFIPCRYQLKIFRHLDYHLLHWTLEPGRINFGTRTGRNYAVFQLVVRMEDESGKRVLEKVEEIPLQVTPEQYDAHSGGLFAFQDILPVIAGRYRLLFLLQNKTGKEFTSFDTVITVPEIQSEPSLSHLLIYQKRSPLPSQPKGRIKAFAFLDHQYLVNAQNLCVLQNEIGVYCQIHHVPEPESKDLRIEIFPADGETPALRRDFGLLDLLGSDGMALDTGPLSLSQLAPGYYRTEVSILGSGGDVILQQRENMIVSSQALPVVPWAYAKLHASTANSEHFTLLATQYFSTQQYSAAENLLRKALQIDPDSTTKILLARTLFAEARYHESLALLLPVERDGDNLEVVRMIAANYAELKDWNKALEYLDLLLSHTTELDVLNLAAECHFNVGQMDQARQLLHRSLSINPNQIKIQDMLKRIEKRNHDSRSFPRQ